MLNVCQLWSGSASSSKPALDLKKAVCFHSFHTEHIQGICGSVLTHQG